jgi:hypothetical protein
LVKRDDPGETWVVLFPECNRMGSWGVGGFITGLQMVDVSGLLESGLLAGIPWGRQLGVGGIGHLRVGFFGVEELWARCSRCNRPSSFPSYWLGIVRRSSCHDYYCNGVEGRVWSHPGLCGSTQKQCDQT